MRVLSLLMHIRADHFTILEEKQRRGNSLPCPHVRFWTAISNSEPPWSVSQSRDPPLQHERRRTICGTVSPSDFQALHWLFVCRVKTPAAPQNPSGMRSASKLRPLALKFTNSVFAVNFTSLGFVNSIYNTQKCWNKPRVHCIAAMHKMEKIRAWVNTLQDHKNQSLSHPDSLCVSLFSFFQFGLSPVLPSVPPLSSNLQFALI